MELFKKLYKKEIKPDLNHFFLVGVVSVFTLLRIPSLFEPDWYGDEAIYQVIGKALLQGRLLYRDIWDNKPPLLYIYYAFVRGDLFFIKLLSLLFGIGAVIIFYFVARSLFQKSKISVILSSLLFSILFGLPLIEGNIANAENFMLFPTLLSLLFVTKLSQNSRKIVPVLIGFLLSISFLTKIVAVFDLSAFILILFTLRFYNKKFSIILKKMLRQPGEFIKIMYQEIIIVASFVVPILCVFFLFVIKGGSSDFLRATFSQNIGYVGWANNFIIPQGFLIIKLLLLSLGVFLVFYFRKKLGIAMLVIYLWLFFSIFNAFFSGRPYTHYVLVVLPAFCLLFGLILRGKKILIFHMAVVFVVGLLLWDKFNYYKKIIPYYKNYYDYVFSKKSTEAYLSFFDSSTPRVYNVASFISMNTARSDDILVLSNSAQIYLLSNKLPPGRYIVAYHIDFYPNARLETKQALQKKQPKYIISTEPALAQDFIWGYLLKYNIQNINIYEKSY